MDPNNNNNGDGKVDIPDETPQDTSLTEEDLRSAGLSDEEISSAKTTGFIKEPEKKKDETKDEKTDEEKAKDGILNKDKKDETPDPDEELDPEKETEILSKYNRNEKALYHAQKKERRKRQRAEAERDQVALQQKLLDKRVKELEEERDRLIAQGTKSSEKKADAIDDELDLLDPEERAKRKPEETDPKKKPLTMEDLERLEKEREDKLAEQNKVRDEKNQRARAALRDFNESGKERYEDFDETIQQTHELVEKAVRGQLGTLFKDPRQISKVERKVKEFLLTVANADEFKEDEFNPADFAYELGKLHPSSGRKSDPDADAEGSKRDGTLTPEQLRRAEKNADRRQPSASVGGGGARRSPVSYDDLTPEQASRLPQSEWSKLPPKVRERLLQSV